MHVMFSVGAPILFRCDDVVLTIDSGDALVMDSMKVLHGVEGVLATVIPTQEGGVNGNQWCKSSSSCSSSNLLLPVHGSRLGVLLWHAAEKGRSINNNRSRAVSKNEIELGCSKTATIQGECPFASDDVCLDGIDNLFPECV